MICSFLVDRMIIYKPTNIQSNSFYSHAGDSFREMLDEWERMKYVTIKESPNPYIWFGNVNETLLYDRPTLQWLNESIKYNIGLFGNPIPDTVINSQLNVPWIFWGRHPTKLEHFHNNHSLSYEDRDITSIFVGKIENEVQNKYRKATDWSKHIDFFHMPYGKPGEYTYTQDEYLKLLSKSKYGLSVRGYGPKCHREVELMALGVVPLITPDVDLTYFNAPIENVHYFRVTEPRDITRIVNETTKEQWQSMSTACRNWYKQNASVKGSFETTRSIINKYKSYKKPSSVCTICTKNSIHDLKVFLRSFETHEPNTPIILLCDDYVQTFVNNIQTSLKITTDVCLNFYSNKNRKIMEREGIFTTFLCMKATSIDNALSVYKDTLFLDSDICLMGPLPFVDTSAQIGLSPHYIKKTNTDNYGYYNSGYIYVNTPGFTKWWRDAIPTSKFFEQGCLEDAPKHFSYFEFDMQDNFGWWRLLECNDPTTRAKQFGINQQQKWITYNGARLRSIHTHLSNDNFPLTIRFNQFVLDLADKVRQTYTYLFDITPIITIICQYYNDKDSNRQHEIDYCFKHNLNNPYVKRIIHFQEEETNIPEWLAKHAKFSLIHTNGRLTYKRAFQYASKHLQKEFVCVCNADIFLTNNSRWDEMYNHLSTNNNVMYALSRHDFDGHNKLFKDPALQKIAYAHAQDAWFFIPPIAITDCDFCIGTLGCDNAIAHRFKQAGYIPINSPNKYKIGHYDICRGKTGSNYMNNEFYSRNKGKKSPEKNGYYLLPDIDAVKSVDNLLEIFKVSEEYKYTIICNLMSEFVKIKN